jgi:hypothetical protein
LFGPEAFVSPQPGHRLFQRRRCEAANDGAAGFGARDQGRARQHVEMLHDRRQRHGKRTRKIADGSAFPLAQLGDQRAPRRIGERRENVIQIGVLIVNHIVNNTTRAKFCQPSRDAARRPPTDGSAPDSIDIHDDAHAFPPDEAHRSISPEDREPVFAMMSRLAIDRLGARGEGVAQGPDGAIFVPYTLAGETIVAEVDGSRGTLAEVLTPSPHRIAPFCRYFAHCGGCAVQTLAADSYARWKRELVTRALVRAGLTIEVLDLADAHGAGRRRATFHARFARGRPTTGFMRARAHEVVEIQACPLLAASMDGALPAARARAGPRRLGQAARYSRHRNGVRSRCRSQRPWAAQ